MLGMGPEGPQVELNDELRAELLEELAMLNGGGERMPGDFGGDEGEGEDDDEGEWEDEEGAEENTRNVLQRLANLFGVGGQAGDAAQAGQDDHEQREEDR